MISAIVAPPGLSTAFTTAPGSINFDIHLPDSQRQLSNDSENHSAICSSLNPAIVASFQILGTCALMALLTFIWASLLEASFSRSRANFISRSAFVFALASLACFASRHPQDCIVPYTRASWVTITPFPQTHAQNHRWRGSYGEPLRKTVNAPKVRPEISDAGRPNQFSNPSPASEPWM